MARTSVLMAGYLFWVAGVLGPAQIVPAQNGERTPPGVTREPPSMPVEEIIRRFAAKEAEFKIARDQYTYTQTVRVQEYDRLGHRGGEYRTTSEVIFTPEGKRYERITYAPASTLSRISISREDIQDLENIQPFVLTTDNLPKYNLSYVGRQHVDEIDTYVFRISPKRIEKGQRYFEGTIWVDDQDLQIVKSDGKAVPDIRHGGSENLFPRFETYRENVDGKYWFPTYTRGDDMLKFSTGEVHVRMIVRYSEYKRFTVTTRIGAQPANPDKILP